MDIVAQKKENSKRYLPHAISTKEGASNCGFTSQPVKDIGRPPIPYAPKAPGIGAGGRYPGAMPGQEPSGRSVGL